MNVKTFENYNEKDDNDNIIKNSKIHPVIKEILLQSFNNEDNSYKYESDFLFGNIYSLITKGYCKNISKSEIQDEDFELPEEVYYKWFVKYFSEYLTGLKSDIVTESGYPLFTPDGKCEKYFNSDKNLFDTYNVDEELDLTIDFNIINNYKGNFYFDEN